MSNPFLAVMRSRLVLVIGALVLAVLWTVFFWPAIIPGLGALVGEPAGPTHQTTLMEHGAGTVVRVSLTAALLMVIPAVAYLCGITLFRLRSSDSAVNLQITGALGAGLITLGTFAPGALSGLLFSDTPQGAFHQIASDHLDSSGTDSLVAQALLSAGTTAAILAAALVIGMFTAPKPEQKPDGTASPTVKVWMVLPVVAAVVVGLAVGLLVPLHP
ncbi:hypothetical protein [Micrococcus terreus]|uniref:hypothetical protein n=1 Tax=Micrococcus terreus TaxID=574650 RepID=UPI00295588B4|nr:hypothetical protein [Micrococcus terreus]MDK7701782.1 hypothetical protein [Micrococcus terreus]WOO96723.1 hypothetical protein R3I42_09245 [Micrococcus terreus]